MKSILLLLGTLVLGTNALSAADPQRFLKPEDFAALRDVDEPNISPDRESCHLRREDRGHGEG